MAQRLFDRLALLGLAAYNVVRIRNLAEAPNEPERGRAASTCRLAPRVPLRRTLRNALGPSMFLSPHFPTACYGPSSRHPLPLAPDFIISTKLMSCFIARAHAPEASDLHWPKVQLHRSCRAISVGLESSPGGPAISDGAAFAMIGSVSAEGEVSAPERFTTRQKCPACGCATAYEVPTGGGTSNEAQARRVEHLWSWSSAGTSSGSLRRPTTGTRRTSTSSPDKALARSRFCGQAWPLQPEPYRCNMRHLRRRAPCAQN